MSCENNNCSSCLNNFKIKNFGTSDLSRISLLGDDRTTLNWSEISVPEIFPIPTLKPDIESIDQVYVNTELNNVKLIATPFAYEGSRTYNITAAELALIDSLVIEVTAGLPNLTAVATAITTFVAVFTGLGIILPTAVQDILDDLTAAATALGTASTAVNNALAAAGALTINSSICTVVTTLQTLYNTLAAVNVILNGVLDLVNDLVALIATLPIFEPFAALISAAVSVLRGIVNAAITAIATLLTLIIDLINQLSQDNFFILLPNEEGTFLTGRKIIVEGFLNQKVVYTAALEEQSVHSAHFCVPFSAFIIPYANFDGLTYAENITVVTSLGTCTTRVVSGFYYNPSMEIIPDLTEDFNVNVYVEDVFVYTLDPRTIFKNITLFFQAKPSIC